MEFLQKYIVSFTPVETFFLLYFIVVYGLYFAQAISSTFQMFRFKKHRESTNLSKLLKSEYLPRISLIAPAYNESAVVIDSVQSLLNLHYFNYELIVVNDGSKDNTLDLLIGAFDLQASELPSYSEIKSEPVRNVYTSTNPKYKNLKVVDKVNGRKADAINAGINYGNGEYFGIIDLDCLLEPDTLLCLVEPVLKEKKKKVVAVGGVIGATNEAIVRNGTLIKEKSPDSFISRIQIIEYFRSFLMSRPAWSRHNALLLISGALGLFEREVLIGVNGYTHDSIGEDMDLVIKIHKYCLDNDIDYKVDFIPFPLCWTELPFNYEILGRQRNRWMRGTIQCMIKYRGMFFNPKYGKIGFISFPYWFMAEMCAPVIEALGAFLILCLVLLGILNWPFTLALFGLVFCLSILLSTMAIFTFYLCFNKYSTIKDFVLFLKAAVQEPFIYHPRVLKWSLKGYYDYFVNKSNIWGEMTRQGFGGNKAS